MITPLAVQQPWQPRTTSKVSVCVCERTYAQLAPTAAVTCISSNCQFKRKSGRKWCKCRDEWQLPINQQHGACQCQVCSRSFHSKGGLSVDNCTKATPLTVSASQVSPVTSCAVTTRLDHCSNCYRCFKSKAGRHGHNCHRRQHRQNSADHRDFFILLSRMQEGFSSSTRS